MQSPSRWCLLHLALASGLVFAISGSTRAQPEFVEMLPIVPGDANFLAMVKVKELYQAPLALREKWDEQTGYERTLGTGVRRSFDYIIFASQLNLGQNLQRSWEVIVATPTVPLSIEQVAKSENGSLDTLSDTPVVWSPRNAFVVEFDPRLYAARLPVDRQETSRWIREAKARKDPAVSPYLQKVASTVQGVDAQIVMAFDTADLFTTALLRPHVAAAAAIDLKVDDIDAISEALATTQGIVLGIKVDTEVTGLVRLDLSGSTAPLKRVGKALLLEAMQGIGATVDDLKDWRVKFEEQSITLTGPLSSDGARRLTSLLDLSFTAGDPASTAEATPSTAQPGSTGSVGPDLETTKKYFNTLRTLVEDLEKDKVNSQRTMALWCDRYASKIEQLPILGVDPELLDFGRKISGTFRDLSLTGQSSKLNILARQTTDAATSSGGGYGYGGYYGYGYGPYIEGTSRLAMERITKQENVKATAYETQVWAIMEQALGDMDRKLTEKYGVEF